MEYGYTLIIAEKVKAARKIAEALSYGKACVKRINKIPYWTFNINGELYIVAAAAGHLFGLRTLERGFPTFSYEWTPLWTYEKSSKHLKSYHELLRRLCSNARFYINACDYDIEGSVIGYMIIKFLGDPSKARRMKFSSLTPEEIRSSFRKISKTLDWNMIEAGICRHELDWIWGINTSRALMEALKISTGKRLILSAGRVQSPTLIDVTRKYLDRETFIPIPYFRLEVLIAIGNKTYKVEYLGGKFNNVRDAKKVADKIKDVRYGRIADVKLESIVTHPPPPFNLGDLQAEAARIYGYSPYETQKIAESLYLDALISYPRTNSQKLPPTLNYNNILHRLSSLKEYSDLIEMLMFETEGKLIPRQGRKDDPAHPAIYPTGLIPKTLKDKERQIYNLIIRRFLACFASDVIKNRLTAIITANGYRFKLQVESIDDYGWLKYYSFYKEREDIIPKIKIGDEVEIVRVSVTRQYTQPPPKISKASILKWMEGVNIGTEATRARIIETLFERGYLKYDRGTIQVTDLGLSISRILKIYFTELTSVELTRKFELYLNNIRSGNARREEVVNEAKKTLLIVLENFKRNIHEAGVELSKSLKLVKPIRTCMICGREAKLNNLCEYHNMAYNKIIEYYDVWRNSLGDLDFNTYLNTLQKLSGTGRLVKDVVNILLKGMLKA